MDARLVRDFDETYARVLARRQEFKDEPWVPGQSSTMKPNPAIDSVIGDGIHLRGLAALLGPKLVEEQLKKEQKASEKLARWMAAEIEREGATVRGAKGSYIPNPMALPLRQTQAHLRGVMKLLRAANAEVPVDDEELVALLD